MVAAVVYPVLFCVGDPFWCIDCYIFYSRHGRMGFHTTFMYKYHCLNNWINMVDSLDVQKKRSYPKQIRLIPINHPIDNVSSLQIESVENARQKFYCID